MKKTLKKDFLLLLFCSFAVFAGKNKISITHIEEPLYYYSNRFIITFSEPVQRLASDKIPIIISPKIHCNWVWIDAMNLSCNLENYSQDDENDSKPYTIQSFQKATTYKLKLKKGLRGINNLPIKPQTKTFTFLRPQLNSFSTYEWLAPNSPILKLVFNQKIQKKSLKNKVYLKATDSIIALKLFDTNKLTHAYSKLSYGQTESIFFETNQPMLEGKDYHLFIKEGVKSTVGQAPSLAYTSQKNIQTQKDFEFFHYQCKRKITHMIYPGPCYAEDTIVVLFKSLIAKQTALQCEAAKKYKISTQKLSSHLSQLILAPLKTNKTSRKINLLSDCIESLHDIFGRKITLKNNKKPNIKTIGLRPKLQLNLPETTTISNKQQINFVATSLNVEQFYWHIDKINNKEFKQTILVKVNNKTDKQVKTVLPLATKVSIPQKNIQSISGYISLGILNESSEHYLKRLQEIPFLVQKTPFLINFRYNSNYAYLQLNDNKTAKAVAKQKITLIVDGKSYHGITDKKGQVNLKITATHKEHFFALQFSHKKKEYFLKEIENNSNLINKEYENNDYLKIPENSYDVYGMTDKPIYRPGEKVKFKFYLRQKKDKNYIIPTQKQTFKVYIDYANAQCWKYERCRSFYVKEVKTLDEFGGFADEFRLPKSLRNGYYRINYRFKNKNNLLENNSSLIFQVSNYKGSDYKLTLDTPVKYAKGRETIPLHATAAYYSGGYVKNEKSQIVGRIEVKNISEVYPQYYAYDFGYEDEVETVYLDDLEFNNKGELYKDFTPPENTIEFGQIKLNAGLKPKNAEWNYSQNLILPFRQKDFFLGLKFSSWALQTDKPLNLTNILIDYKGQEHQAESFEYKIADFHEDKYQTLHCQNKSIKICQFKLAQAGLYKLIAKAHFDGKIYEREISFLVYAPFSNQNEAKNPEITLFADKKIYAIGETATITIKSPLPNVQASIVAERNHILNSWVKRTRNGLLKIKLKITEKYAPGFDVSALIQATKQKKSVDNIPEIKQTSLTLKVKEPKNKKLFSIKTDKKTYKPKEKVKLTIKSLSSNNSDYIVAVIDQSIVDLVNSKKLYNFKDSYYSLAKYHWDLMRATQISQQSKQRNSLTVFNDGKLIDNRGRLLFYPINEYDEDKVELERVVTTGSHIKAEDIEISPSMSRGKIPRTSTVFSINRTNSVTTLGDLSITPSNLRTLFAEAAFYKTDINLNAKTDQTVEFQLPDNITQWRIIVLGTDKSGQLEFNQSTIRASKDLELRSTIPLQATQGDKFLAEFSVVSKTNMPDDIQVAAQAKSDKNSTKIKKTFQAVQKLERQTFSLPVKAIKSSNISITVLAKSKENADGIQHDIAIRPAQVKLSKSKFGQFDSTIQTFNIIKPKNLASLKAEFSLSLAGSLLPSLNPVYEYIHHYPFSCWEQENAKAVIAAIEVESDKTLSSQEIATKKNLVQDILNEAQDFQAPNGGMTFWNGRNKNVNLYLSLYTLDNFRFLKELGYKIPENVYQNLTHFGHEFLGGVYYLDPQIARLGKNKLSAEIQLMALRYLDNLDAYQVDSIKSKLYKQRQSLNLSALNQLLNQFNGQKSKQVEILKLIRGKFYSTEKKYVPKMLNTSFWYLLPSANKIQCDLIRSQLQLKDELINKNDISKHIYGILDRRDANGTFGSTLENSYCAKALYAFAKKYEDPKAHGNYQVELNGQKQEINPVKIEKDINLKQDLRVKISNNSSQQTYYTAKLSYQVQPESIKKQNHGFALDRQYYVFVAGKWQQTNSYKTGDWVKTVLIVDNPISRKFVALSDPVPGGWLPTDIYLANNMPVGIRESENYSDNSPYFYERQLNPATTRFFADFLPAGRHKISYYSQIRNAGTFTALPARVEEMYDDENRATTLNERLTIDK